MTDTPLSPGRPAVRPEDARLLDPLAELLLLIADRLPPAAIAGSGERAELAEEPHQGDGRQQLPSGERKAARQVSDTGRPSSSIKAEGAAPGPPA